MSQTFPATVRSPSGVSAERVVRHFNQIDLSRRWNISPRTLERWRWLKHGPEYLKIGGRVLYRTEDIEAYEKAQLQRPTSSSGPFSVRRT